MSTSTIASRVLMGGIAAGVVLQIFADGLNLTLQGAVIHLISGILYVATMTPLALSLHKRRFWAIFLPLYLTGAATDLIEGYFYTTLLTPFKLVAALIFEGVGFLIITAIIVWLIPTGIDGEQLDSIWARRSLSDWLWRIVLAGVLYIPFYFGFAFLVTPIEHPYYHDAAFVASLHTHVPPTSVSLAVEAFRGVLFVLALLPVLAVFPTRRWQTVLYMALIGVVLEAWVPLLGLTTWPLGMRLGNLLELTGDAVGRALVVILLLAFPANQQRVPAREPAVASQSGQAGG